MTDAISQRKMQLADSIAAWDEMRWRMNAAQPGTQYECWTVVEDALCKIARSIREDEKRSKEKEARDE